MRNNPRRGAAARLLPILLCVGSLQGIALGQGPQAPPQKLAYGVDRANVPDAIARVKSGDFAAVHVDLIARAGAVEAVPILKEEFVSLQDPLLKAKIAAALIRLGDKEDNTYWDFLVKQASVALESRTPNFTGYDAGGKALNGPSPQFEAWLKTSGTSAESAAEESLYTLPGRVLILGWSRDPRAIPYLRLGLSSPNYMIQIAASKGLAEIGDEESVPLIIAACQKAPAEVAAVIAESLVYFDAGAAQNAVDRFLPKDVAKLRRDAKASGQTKPLSPPLYDKAPSQ